MFGATAQTVEMKGQISLLWVRRWVGGCMCVTVNVLPLPEPNDRAQIDILGAAIEYWFAQLAMMPVAMHGI